MTLSILLDSKKRNLAEQKATTQTTAEKSSSQKASSAGAGSGRKNLVNDSSYYSDKNEMCAQKAFSYLKKSSLFDGNALAEYNGRMVNAANALVKNDKWKVNMDADGDGKKEDVNLADAIADSFDSELDLYIQSEFEKIVKKYGSCSKKYLSKEALAELKSKGIEVSCVGNDSNRVYSFSLVDKDGNVMEDENGKKGSIIFADCLIPDGYAQGAEINLSAILDTMGKDCISKADFVGKEDEYYALLKQVEANVQSGAYDAKSKLSDIYGNTKDISKAIDDLWGGHGGSSFGMGGIPGNEKVDTSKMTEEEKKAYEEEIEYEVAESSDAAKDAYKVNIEVAKAKYKEENGEDATGVALQNLISGAKAHVASIYGDDFVAKIDFGSN